MEDERETVLHDPRELDKVAPVVHVLRAVLDRGQECPVRDGLRDTRVRGFPVAQILGEVPVRVVVHLQQDQAQLILLNKDALQLGGQLGIFQRELNRFQEHD